ncbi:helix-turn-helix domain-containing protein [Actinoplanes auranticolor]|uniref:helix-turn-helix domain-containing protein n=1 Tax=Actinoplanes auranticolor TaxID=47988 RepID=UPI001FE4887E|nr:helix-turn-helix domain-containing protein [Actinoplanes auranticolor]
MGGLPRPKLPPVVLTVEEREALESLTRRRTTAQALALRARIVLACADGHSNSQVARLLGVSRPTVTTWRSRFLTDRVDGLFDEPRPSQNSLRRPGGTRDRGNTGNQTS